MANDQKNKTFRSLFGSVFTLVILIFILALNITVAWFTINRSVGISGAHISPRGFNFDVSVTKDNEIDWINYDNTVIELDFDDLFCGISNKRTLDIKITNNGDRIFYISWLLSAPTAGEEIPYFDSKNQLYYYLGSQIQIYDIKINNNNLLNEISGIGKYLVPIAPEDEYPPTALSSEQLNIPQINLIQNLPVTPGETQTIQITFVFVDNGSDQSVYQGFYEDEDFVPFTGFCSRRLGFFVKGA